jgi:bacillithiol biosynthesis cysteine-adding enzyme BshC
MRSVGRAFSNSYLADEPAARGFMTCDFREAGERVARTRSAAARRVEPALMDVLREQQARLPPSQARQANLAALSAGETAVVVTGQQVGLFLGPLYSFYKAACTVVAARRLQAEAGVRCVPLFWLQTEDHDFAEIASSTIADGKGDPIRLSLPVESAAEARTAIAQRCLGPEIDDVLGQLSQVLPAGPAAQETLALLRAHYRPGTPLAAAFAGVMASLFAEEGLLFLDPRDSRVAVLSAPLYREALHGAERLERALAERRAALAAAGFDEQITLRPACSLLFYHQGQDSGPRYRLQRAAGKGTGWSLAGCAEIVSDEDLETALQRGPLRFSTSALLRPIVQDALFPTAAYVGGPGELNYFAQLAPVYAHFGVTCPLVIPRARFRCVDARARRLLHELGLSADELARPIDEVLARLASLRPDGGPDPAALRSRVNAELTPAVEALFRDVTAGAPQLAGAAARTRASIAQAFGRLIGRYERALAERDGVARGRFERLQAALAPGGVPQERVYGWPSLAGRHGPAAFTRLVFETLDRATPFPTTLLELTP